jgi:hypothetical protein
MKARQRKMTRISNEKRKSNERLETGKRKCFGFGNFIPFGRKIEGRNLEFENSIQAGKIKF